MIVRHRASGRKVGHLDSMPLVELLTERATGYATSEDQWSEGGGLWVAANNRGQTALARVIAGDEDHAKWRRYVQRVLRKDADGNPTPEHQWVHVDVAEHICHALNVMPHFIWPDYLAVSEEWVDYLLEREEQQARKLNQQLSLLEAS